MPTYMLLIIEPTAQRADQNDAVAIARLCPAAEWATVEVRSLAPCFDDSQA